MQKVVLNLLNETFPYKTSCYFPHVGSVRFFSDKQFKKTRSFKLVVVGGGSGGTGIAHKFARTFKKDLAIIEPSEVTSFNFFCFIN